MRSIAFGAAASVFILSGCVEEVGEVLADPGAFECRERGASVMSAAFEDTTAEAVNFDAFGNRNYTVNAGGIIFRCSVNSDDVIVQFNRV